MLRFGRLRRHKSPCESTGNASFAPEFPCATRTGNFQWRIREIILLSIKEEGISATKQTALGPAVLSNQKSPSPKQLYHGLLPFHSFTGSRDWAASLPIAELGLETRLGVDSIVEHWWARVKLTEQPI
jgi:hypothetical protein